MTEEEQQLLLSQAVLNVPNEETNLYEEFICKPKIKSDLRSATDFEHKIELKTTHLSI